MHMTGDNVQIARKIWKRYQKYDERQEIDTARRDQKRP